MTCSLGAGFGWLLDPGGLSPHGFCLAWDARLVWLHAVSDAMIGLAYFSIPAALIWFVTRGRDLTYGWMYALFAAFILACGATHWFSILTLFLPAYGLEGVVKALTAAISIATAVALWPLIPKALALPSPSDLAKVNRALRASQGFLKRTGGVAGVGGWEFDLANGAITWSDIVCELHDLPAGSSPDLEKAFSYCDEAWQPVLRAAVQDGIERGKSWDLELPYVSALGAAILGARRWARGI